MVDRSTIKSIRLFYWSYNLFRYLRFIRRLKKSDRIDKNLGYTDEGLPVPPALLRHRVNGNLSRDHFIEVSKELSKNITELCESVRYSIYDFKKILDFGSGTGRVIGRLYKPNSSEFYGTDIDQELLDWCSKHWKNINFSKNNHLPPLSFADNTFDFIYPISVFTHLDEDFQNKWLEELKRVAKPNAILILTLHGQACINKLVPSYRQKAKEDGILFVESTTGKLKLDQLPDFYQYTYHTSNYILKEWSKYFEIISHKERAINNHQDAVILKNSLK